MADAQEQTIEIFFPFKGKDESLGFKNQIPMTTPIMINCRLRDIAKNRARGGQRPGLSKAFETQVGGDQPILKLISINTTYISPV